jgi:folylpolyglutamate synthase/dihydropteroate synthase
VHPEALIEWFDHERLRTAGNLTEALRMTREAAPEDAIFIAGSLQLVGEARARFVG